MTQADYAKSGKITSQIKYIYQQEKIDSDSLREKIATGQIVLLANKKHKALKPVAVGRKLSVKVNANIGTSPVELSLEKELKKLTVAIGAGADTSMDLTIVNDAMVSRIGMVAPTNVNIIDIKVHSPSYDSLSNVKQADWMEKLVKYFRKKLK